jgi:hypothetical protein
MQTNNTFQKIIKKQQQGEQTKPKTKANKHNRVITKKGRQ